MCAFYNDPAIKARCITRIDAALASGHLRVCADWRQGTASPQV